jgi:hypothetical protein
MPQYMVIQGAEGRCLVRETRTGVAERLAGQMPQGFGEIVRTFTAENDSDAMRILERDGARQQGLNLEVKRWVALGRAYEKVNLSEAAKDELHDEVRRQLSSFQMQMMTDPELHKEYCMEVRRQSDGDKP